MQPKRVITGLRIFTVCLAKAGTGRNPTAKIVLAKAGSDMNPEEMQAALDQLQSSLSEEQMALVMALIEAGKAPAEPEVKAEEPAQAEEPAPEVKAEEPAPEVKADDEEKMRLQKANDDLEAELEKARAELAARDEATAIAGFVAKASEDMAALPGIKPAELGMLLKAASAALDDAQMAQLTGVLKSASAAIGKSTLLKAVGSDGDSTTAGGRLDHEINVLRKAHPELSPQQALVRVAKSNPGLFAAAAKE